MSGLTFGSINELPEKMRQQVAEKILADHREKQKHAKYGNVKAEAGGITFDSTKERDRFLLLMFAQRAGAIRDLRLQQNFTLVEGFTLPDGKRIRPVVYKADFVYRVADITAPGASAMPRADLEYWRGLQPGDQVIEDVKSQGTRTRVYINKMKTLAEKGYMVREV